MLETILQTEIEEILDAVIFGDGFWIVFIMVMAMCLVVANRVKYSGIIFAIAMVFLAVLYSENLSGASNQMWGVILCFIGVAFLCGQLISDFRK